MATKGQFTVIVFKELQFKGEWVRDIAPNFATYTAASEKNQLIALVEDRAGNNMTYLFVLKPRDVIWVNYADSQAHIPAICTSGVSGDKITCQRKG